jgi:thiol-disulfide isomerase/thioredoxin
MNDIYTAKHTKRVLIIFLCTIVNCFNSYAQSISGNLSLLANQKINLEGFSGLKNYPISNATIDESGNFKLTYSISDYGIGYLMSADKKPLFLILSGEDIELVGEALSYNETLKIKKGKENLLFERYAKEHPRREQALSAWLYLEKIYFSDSLFTIQKAPSKAIQTEKQRIKKEDANFLNQLPKVSYVSWYLPSRKLVSSVSVVAQHRPQETANTLYAFREIDYTDSRLYKSGLFKDAIENHFWLIENCGKSIDSVFIEMKISIDMMLPKLAKNEKIFNEVTDYLFDLLERHSLFQASEYLALKVLNEGSCNIENNLAKQLETYRTMKKGNIAPDVTFAEKTFFSKTHQSQKPSKLSELTTPFTLMIFGSSSCPKCIEEIPEIANLYTKWREQGVEVVFVSLDEKLDDFQKFSAEFPFISTCDFKKWESPIVQSYFVFGTPTMFLLDQKREILLRPNSTKQMDAWVEWYLIQKK